jgi:hypothetical protein
MILEGEAWSSVSSGLLDRLEGLDSPRLPGSGDKGSKSSRERLAIFERGVNYFDPHARLFLRLRPAELQLVICRLGAPLSGFR